MVKIHVEQTTDTDWEIRTGSDHEDRAVAGTVTVTGPTSAKGSCGSVYFKGLQPGAVVGQIIDYLRTGQTPQPQIRSVRLQG